MQTATDNRQSRNPLLQTVSPADFGTDRLLAPQCEPAVSANSSVREFRMVCQPICKVTGRGGPAWVEMLIRGTRTGARTSPMEIVRRGYRHAGLEFDLVVLDAALATAAGLRSDTRIGVNIRPCSLNRPGFIPALQEILKRRRIAPERLVLELVEFYGPVRLESAHRTLKQLREMGVLIALDDFGPGHPNLDVLAEGLVDFVKLDRSLVNAMELSPRQGGVLQGIAALAESTGFTLVAEGIETPAQMNALRRLGIEWMQGFLFGHPVALGHRSSSRRNQSTFAARSPTTASGFNPATPSPTTE